MYVIKYWAAAQINNIFVRPNALLCTNYILTTTMKCKKGLSDLKIKGGQKTMILGLLKMKLFIR